MLRSFKNLSPKTRLGVGLAIISWGLAGPYLSDAAESRMGLTPSERDKEELDRMTPHITVVDAKSGTITTATTK
ncbi:hypothetical protein GMORB2_0501 [Geosmithia morbida]|uniref:Uncharacterized protein n=1 Tax=Geosmithia morbida TaxID=1094350 RepID=A0A9P4Z4Z0_9HYPO|nr:uncharacterized protein GMORB2_0501 [Geosmithia morbida]KAF4126764.1 hypothetical protein GMORB2_0501 [Geosmithia morbida]